MKNITKNRWPGGAGRGCRVALVSAVLMLSGITLQARANTLNLDFTYTVVQGTCQIDVSPPSVNFSTLNSELSTLISGNWVVVGQTMLSVTLSDCSGAADPATRPAIELKGVRASESWASQVRKDSVFSDSTNTTGLGVVFAKSDNATGLGSTNLLTYDSAKNGMFIYTESNANTTAQNKTYSIRTGLACGTTADCAASHLKVASGSATVTFSFTYR